MAMAPPPRAARDLLLATAAVWLVLELRQAGNTRAEAVTADRGSRPVLRVATAIGVVVALVAARVLPGAAIGPRAGAAWLGLALLWCGIALRLWAFRTLGRYFTFTVQTSGDQPVIDAGPYRFVRHPSYSALLLAVTGLGLFIGNWASLVCLVVGVTVGLVYRIRIEEEALLRDLGDRYRDYAARHKRLVPLIW
jgi:protein-S-isoprenylcysteine O-methyltransferase Ste14